MNISQSISYLYGKIIQWRNQLYDTGRRVSIQFTVPVISVGNLNTGGTGKTPHVAYLVAMLQATYQTAVLSRGYKRRSKGFVLADEHSTADELGDEPMQLKMQFPDLTVAVSENRAMGIPLLLHHARQTIQVIILDDAFQHRVVRPQLSILLTEYDRPYTRDTLLPAGRLREPIAGAARADIIIVSKSPATLHHTDRQTLIAELKPLPRQIVLFSHLRYEQPYPLAMASPIEVKRKMPKINLDAPITVLLFCGIARTEAIEKYLRSQYQTVETLYFSDHHRYTNRDLRQLQTTFEALTAPNKIIITTEKDAARLQLLSEKIATLSLPIYCLPVSVGFNETDAALLHQAIERSLIPYHAVHNH